MGRLFTFFLSQIYRWRHSHLLGNTFAAAAMAEGGDEMARDYLRMSEEDKEQVEALRLEFKTRYHGFKTLLQANNSALENMASMEKKIQECKPFPYSFIEKSAISISVDVFRMIRSLDEIVPGKYPNLYEVFYRLQAEIETTLDLNRSFSDRRLIIPIDQCDKSMGEQVGNKMAMLGEIGSELGMSIHKGFVVTSYAQAIFFRENKLNLEISKQQQYIDFENIEALEKTSRMLQKRIIEAEVPTFLRNEIQKALTILKASNPHLMLAIRSSASGEDTVRTSTAGQYLSKLNIREENIEDAYKAVVASKYSMEAMIYRFNHGLIDEQVSMAVGCLPMINAVAGGVIYSSNPVYPNDTSLHVNSCWGLPKSVVEGDAASDQFVVSRQPPHDILEKEILTKSTRYEIMQGEGIIKADMPERLDVKPSLSESQVSELAVIALKLETYFNKPQDIEWCIDSNGTIKVLQCRPLSRFDSSIKLSRKRQRIESSITLLFKGGITVSPNRACGAVYWVENREDFNHFPQGAIACVRTALPRWAPLLSRASGIVAEEGGFAGHLANVAREFKVPGLFGVKAIRNKLANGTLITLDADHREIHQGKIDLSAEEPSEKDHLIAGSPVHNKLKEVSSAITPLHLIDPDSADFRPSRCTSLHDITRFVHEKSVSEMFDFGKQHHFSERSGKQLFYKVPMQWWVLNLDDGFIKETSWRYVHLDNIASIPMQALWRGIVAVPWEGPPPIDGRGFLSVMFQATTNHSLTTSRRSVFADKNFFMISKNFCNLSSRLGFHFTTVESIVSEENPEENYISFKYKGGAADLKRRTGRIRFLGDLLENYGFSTRTRKDILVAKLENPDCEYVIMRLTILGYLIIHTRQIDIIMMNTTAVSYYRSKFEKDIASIMNS